MSTIPRERHDHANRQQIQLLQELLGREPTDEPQTLTQTLDGALSGLSQARAGRPTEGSDRAAQAPSESLEGLGPT